MSTKPGLTTWPDASNSRAPDRPGPIPLIRPPVTATSASRPGPPVPSITVPPRMTMSALMHLSSQPPYESARARCRPAPTVGYRGIGGGRSFPVTRGKDCAGASAEAEVGEHGGPVFQAEDATAGRLVADLRRDRGAVGRALTRRAGRRRA